MNIKIIVLFLCLFVISCTPKYKLTINQLAYKGCNRYGFNVNFYNSLLFDSLNFYHCFLRYNTQDKDTIRKIYRSIKRFSGKKMPKNWYIEGTPLPPSKYRVINDYAYHEKFDTQTSIIDVETQIIIKIKGTFGDKIDTIYLGTRNPRPLGAMMIKNNHFYLADSNKIYCFFQQLNHLQVFNQSTLRKSKMPFSSYQHLSSPSKFNAILYEGWSFIDSLNALEFIIKDEIKKDSLSHINHSSDFEGGGMEENPPK